MPEYPRLQSLKRINRVMARYYVQRRVLARFRPLAYATSGAPVEIMETMGILTLYPENYGALCGARKAAVGLCQVAEATGYPPDLCSYARNHIGAVLRPKDAPLHGMVRPDVLVCCNNICGTVLKWYEALAALYDVPLFVLDVPFQRTTPPDPHVVGYVADTYTNAWTVKVDPAEPFVSMARAYTGVFINVDLPTRIRIIADLARRCHVDGMVMHANRSCKPFSVTQNDVRDGLRDELGLPILILEADMCDARLYNEGAVQERVAAFLEML